MTTHVQTIILGAGAAGLFCAAEAARRAKSVLVLDHAKKIGEKIRISGGGRCNFTNIGTTPTNFLSNNPKFCISALKRFTARDFIDRVNAANIGWHEKTLGQLFCNDSSAQIIDMLMDDCARTGAQVRSGVSVKTVRREGDGFALETDGGSYLCDRLVVATGGLSIPKIGATGFGYQLAKQFGIPVIATRPGLVPLTFDGPILEMSCALSGVSLETTVTHGKTAFREGFLFTHRGLSGPSILQISNYWNYGEPIIINLLPDEDIATVLQNAKQGEGGRMIVHLLADHLPKRLAQTLADFHGWSGKLAECSDKRLAQIAAMINRWLVVPSGTQGYRIAEVTLGGIDTHALDQRTMMAKSVPGLYFIGEVVDVTGWLGGYNFQWAWSSGYAAGQSV